MVCSGNGQCECGRCACNVGFTGATCAIEQSSSEWNREAGDGEILPSDDDAHRDAHHQHGDNDQKDSASTLSSIATLILLFIGAQFARHF